LPLERAIAVRCRAVAAAIGNGRGANPAAQVHRRGDAFQEDVMTALVNFLNSVRKDEGQDLLEYALLVALIAIVAVGAVTAAGQAVDGIFSQIAGMI
jgi:Flp pilus assembly pilin Flp